MPIHSTLPTAVPAAATPSNLPPIGALPLAAWLQCAEAAVRMQADAWRMACAQADAALQCTHQLLVGMGWPDPLTDRSLWWAAEHFADSLEPFPQKA